MDSNQNNQSAAKNHMLLGILCYIGPLVIISFLMGKDVPFVKFHIKQGLVLIIAEIIISILASVLGSLGALINLLNIVTLVLSIIGIINVVHNKEKELPLIGQYAGQFKF